MKIINLDTWKRREHLDFFSKFDEPMFSISADVNCTEAYNYCKQNHISFFAYYLHKALVAVNEIHEFRCRIINDTVVEFDVINASPTIGRKDETFGFGYIPYNTDFEKFNSSLQSEKTRIQNSSGLGFNYDNIKHDVIHFSSLPWINFTGLTHPRNFNSPDSVPKISFGKVNLVDRLYIMPVSVLAHHGLMDGIHIAKYLEKFESLLG